MARSLVLLGAVYSLSVLAAQTRGALRVVVQAGYDTNPTQDLQSVGTTPDAALEAVALIDGAVATRALEANGHYDFAARAFANGSIENLWAQTANGTVTVAVARVVDVGATLRGRDRHGGERDYSDLAARGFVAFVPDQQLDVRAEAGARRFIYWSAFEFSYAAPELSASARYRFNRHYALSAFGELSLRAFNAQTNPVPGSTAPSAQRRDTAMTFGFAWRYRGPFTVDATYSYLEDDSNSFGESMTRHRLSIVAAFLLPWELVLTLSGAVQLARYPDGIFLSPQYQLLEDTENTDSIAVRLVRPLTEHFDAQLDAATWYGVFPGNNLVYSRTRVTVGIALRL